MITGEITTTTVSSITPGGRPGADPVPEIRLHGTVEPLIVPRVGSCEEAVEGLPGALFEGTYRPQEKALRSQQGEFVVQVFDQGEPGSSREEITGDGFSIQLFGGAYNGYTRAGYIEGGNVRWSP